MTLNKPTVLKTERDEMAERVREVVEEAYAIARDERCQSVSIIIQKEDGNLAMRTVTLDRSKFIGFVFQQLLHMASDD